MLESKVRERELTTSEGAKRREVFLERRRALRDVVPRDCNVTRVLVGRIRERQPSSRLLEGCTRSADDRTNEREAMIRERDAPPRCAYECIGLPDGRDGLLLGCTRVLLPCTRQRQR